MAELHKKYNEVGIKKLQDELKIKNIMQVPKLIKIVIHTGLKEALENKKVLDSMSQQLAIISGQKPITTIAKHDISSFKLRRGEPIGLKVTLRGKKMYDFCEKLVKIVLPRIRDFRGISTTGFDGKGNYDLGLAEQIVFPEVEYNQIDKVRGMQITFVTNAKNAIATRKLLEFLGFPFSKQ